MRVPHPRPNQTILAIDDSRSQCAFYRVALGRYGYVRTAIGMDEAVKHLDDDVALIILGAHLFAGIEQVGAAVEKLKAFAPVILSDDHLDDRDGAQLAGLGVVGRWRRGNDHEQLCWQVERALGARHAAVSPTPTFLRSPKERQ